MEPIIRVENLGKRYVLGSRDAAYGSLRESIVAAMRAPLRRLRNNGVGDGETLWALRDVNFEVAHGEVMGIIGRNGAGKSTLLKVLSRITEPTTGRAELYGRVASLLEVGTGFHPELTGRENVYLNGAILGMSKAEIDRKFDEIVAFAELEKFLDTPVKRYSSGMYMRLAFAVASHLEPEILIVDEVLAVGDAAFQKKCLGKMGEVARQGRTVLFVSHNMSAIRSLCSTAIWLDGGKIVDSGEANQIVLNYTQKGALAKLEQSWPDPAEAPGTNVAKLRDISIAAVGQDPFEPFTVKTSLRLTASFWNYVPDTMLNVSVVINNLEGLPIFNSSSVPRTLPEGLIQASFVIPGDFLNDGAYTVRILLVKDGSDALFDLHEVLLFEVLDAGRVGSWYGKVIGAVRPQFDWEVRTDH